MGRWPSAMTLHGCSRSEDLHGGYSVRTGAVDLPVLEVPAVQQVRDGDEGVLLGGQGVDHTQCRGHAAGKPIMVEDDASRPVPRLAVEDPGDDATVDNLGLTFDGGVCGSHAPQDQGMWNLLDRPVCPAAGRTVQGRGAAEDRGDLVVG